MDKIDIPALRRVAEVATPGNWVQWDKGDDVYAGCGSLLVLKDRWVPDDQGSVTPRFIFKEDAAYVAAFQPRVALQLLARIEALEAAHREIVALDEGGGSGSYECSAISRRALGDEG